METPIDKISYAEFICRECIHLDDESLVKLGSIIFNEDPDKINDCPDGCRILLDDLPIDILKQMTTFIKNQLQIT